MGGVGDEVGGWLSGKALALHVNAGHQCQPACSIALEPLLSICLLPLARRPTHPPTHPPTHTTTQPHNHPPRLQVPGPPRAAGREQA